MTGPAGRPSRTEILLRAREFLRARGQVPRTEDLSGNPGEAAWQLLAQVLDVIDDAGSAPVTGRMDLLAGLRADYPGWEIWKREERPRYCAWLVLSQPAVVLYADTVTGLRGQLEQRAEGGNDDAC